MSEQDQPDRIIHDDEVGRGEEDIAPRPEIDPGAEPFPLGGGPDGNGDSVYAGIGPSPEQIAEGYAKGAPKPHYVTAFLVVLNPNGAWVATPDVNHDYEMEREASLADYIPAASQVLEDVKLMRIVQNVVGNVLNAQMQAAQQLAEQQRQAAEHEAIQRQIAAQGGFKGPGGTPRHFKK